jgi:hypothetical protein
VSDFGHRLALGKLAESRITEWIRTSLGYSVMPVYEVEFSTGKGPQVFAPDRGLVAPDLFVLKGKRGALWVEAKRKTAFTWYRKDKRWVTGIDLHHYADYLEVRQRYSWPLWLLFLHDSGVPSEEDQGWKCPQECPAGLFGEEILYLEKHESHRHKNHGRHGMVYWGHDVLRLLADVDMLNKQAANEADSQNPGNG